MTNPRVKTLELLKEWSTWLVAIDTGTLALLGTLGKWDCEAAILVSSVGMVGLLISLIAATVLVGAVPVLVQQITASDIKDSKYIRTTDISSIYQFKYGPFTVQRYSFIQHFSFVIAALLITAAFLLDSLSC